MKIILSTLNAKYIHTSLALRLLYVVTKNSFDVEIKEFTIKEDVRKIGEELLTQNPEVIALSVYIWNVEQTKELIYYLKKHAPSIILIVGGPEVTYEPAFFIENWKVDFIVLGEGEFVFPKLLEAIKNNNLDLELDSVYSKFSKSKVVAKADLKHLEQFDSPYFLEIDKDSIQNKILYFETSRGCPYNCQYCLSSLEVGVRYFSKEYILTNLEKIIKSEVKTVKFLDRTFNLDKEHTETIFNYLIDNYRPNLSCQFEIYADILNPETLSWLNQKLPQNYFRFEIGIQSTYSKTNKAVKRIQKFQLIQQNIKQIHAGAKIDLHLDLIAGLPYETLELFKQSFNDVFAFGAKEVQLGILKMLRGTNLRKNYALYLYDFNTKAPYEIISNQYLSSGDLNKIKMVEDCVEKYWNSGKFSLTLNELLFNDSQVDYFSFFLELYQFYLGKKEINCNRTLELLFLTLWEFLESKDYNYFDLLRTDYYNNYTIRPHGFWQSEIDKLTRKRLLYQIGNDKIFLEKYNLTRQIVEKQMTLDLIKKDTYLLTHFDGKTKEHETFLYHSPV